MEGDLCQTQVEVIQKTDDSQKSKQNLLGNKRMRKSKKEIIDRNIREEIDERKIILKIELVSILENLNVTQDKIKRNETLYTEEFNKHLNIFKVLFSDFIENPNRKIKGIKELILFFCHISHVYTKELSFIPFKLITLIENNYSIINPEIRLSIVEGLSLLRKKNLLDATEMLPLFFKLIKCQDKILRKRLTEIITTDLAKINNKHKNNTINKKIQNFCQEMMKDPNKKAVRKTLNIMIVLYKKKIWNDNKTINTIASACMANDSKLIYAACKFFLSEYEEEEHDTSDEEQLEDLKTKYRLLGKGNSKKTRSKKQRIDKLIKSIDRREKRKSKVKVSKDFMPIDLLTDPFTFCEKLFSKLKSVSEKFKLKIVIIRLLARIIGRHKLLLNNFFSYILSYINPSQKELATIFAALIEASHDLVPPDDLNPILEKLFDNFVTESIPPAQITIGLNAYREICERVPYIMTKPHMTVIENMKDFKNKSVTIAARAAINLCKEINPTLLNLHDDNNEKQTVYGQSKIMSGIDGIDLLKKYEKIGENVKYDYETLLDNNQLKKIKLLRAKYNAEKIQHKKIKLNDDQLEEYLEDKPIKKTKNYAEDKLTDEELKISEENDEGESVIEEDDEMDEGEELEDIEGEEFEDDEDENEGEKDIPDNENEKINIDIDNEDEIVISSNELKSNESEDDDQPNIHGFVDPGDLLTYRKRYNEKKDQLKNEEKVEYKHQRSKHKGGGTTNKEKLKNKPLMMVVPKKRREAKIKLESMNKKIKKIKQQMGRFKRGNMILKKKQTVRKAKK